MKRKDLIIAVMATFCLTATLFTIFPTRSNPGIGEYDAWNDLNDDGKIDIFDAINFAGTFETTGDPTKDVYVTNWPVTNQTTVFYNANHSSASGYYNASGFGHIHITWAVWDLSDPESVTFEFYGMILTPSGSPGQLVVVETWRATENDNWGGVTFPVPSEQFHFYAGFAVGTTARVQLAFYLTYA